MNDFLNSVELVNGAIHNFVWGPVMLVLLVGTGIYLSIRTGFFQFTRFSEIWKNTFGTLFKKDGEDKNPTGAITPFQAVSTALAGTIGTGNIVGVATAITMGGPGAIFWMWLSAFFGMVTKYSEIVLAVKFREKNAEGNWVGGPMYYIEKGLKQKWLAVTFAVFCALASFGIGNMTQINSISLALESSFGIATWITGIIGAIVVAMVIIGGIKRIAKVTERIVPFMALLYITGAIIVLVINYAAIPAAFKTIFSYAFNLNSAVGGAVGYTVMQAIRFGLARGVFSNEAGLGSAPIAHAATSTTNPVRQGIWGIFEVFIDTIIVCSMTALVILTSGLWNSGITGAELTSAAFSSALGTYGGYFVSISIMFFALSTILGWSYYGERSIEYISKSSIATSIYKALFIACIVVGATTKLELVWGIADTLNGLMAIPNLIALLGLSGLVISITKEYLQDKDFMKSQS